MGRAHVGYRALSLGSVDALGQADHGHDKPFILNRTRYSKDLSIALCSCSLDCPVLAPLVLPQPRYRRGTQRLDGMYRHVALLHFLENLFYGQCSLC